MLGLAGAAVLLTLARSAGPGPTQAFLAALLLVGAPIVALLLGGRAGRVFLLVVAGAAWSTLRPGEPTATAIPVLLLNRMAYFAVPPLVIDLLLGEKGRERLRLEPAHVYAPTVVTCLGVVVHLALRWSVGPAVAESEIRWAAVIYAVCYLVLLVAALLVRTTPAAPKQKPAPVSRGLELEESGRFGLASRVYERDGQVEKGAEAAERAGEWARAGFLYRRSGSDFKAAEMYARAQMVEDALDCYERAGAHAAAARLCADIGQTDRALALYERAGDRAAALAVLEQAGRNPTPEQLRSAGLVERAAQAYEAAAEPQRAAEIYEHELHDPGRAAALYAKAGSFVQAGRAFEAVGRLQEALEAYAASPAGALEAARLHVARGAPREAAELLARLPVSDLDKMQDDATLVLVARVMLETGRVDDAVRIAQNLKRRGAATGPLCLLLGRAFLAKGLPELAQEELRLATTLPLEPADEMQASYLLGNVLELSGQAAEALQIFHGLLQKDLGYADVQERYRRLKAGQ